MPTSKPDNFIPVSPFHKPDDGGEDATLHFETNLGSFRVANGFGRIEFTFTGTVLIHGWDYDKKLFPNKTYTCTVTGNVRKEYDEHGREVYFGTGKAVIEGSWRVLQWFGRDMKAVWVGHGQASLIGEFDRNLDTGVYWYSDPTKKQYWPTSLIEVPLPERKMPVSIEPQERPTGK
jgi:hypothetical protein